MNVFVLSASSSLSALLSRHFSGKKLFCQSGKHKSAAATWCLLLHLALDVSICSNVVENPQVSLEAEVLRAQPAENGISPAYVDVRLVIRCRYCSAHHLQRSSVRLKSFSKHLAPKLYRYVSLAENRALLHEYVFIELEKFQAYPNRVRLTVKSIMWLWNLPMTCNSKCVWFLMGNCCVFGVVCQTPYSPQAVFSGLLDNVSVALKSRCIDLRSQFGPIAFRRPGQCHSPERHGQIFAGVLSSLRFQIMSVADNVLSRRDQGVNSILGYSPFEKMLKMARNDAWTYDYCLLAASSRLRYWHMLRTASLFVVVTTEVLGPFPG